MRAASLAENSPLDSIIAMMRGVLVAAGFTRHVHDGTVYFAGGITDGPVVVLLHGVNDHAGTWAQVAPALAKRFRLIIPDLPGHGESEPKSGPLPLPLIVDAVTKIIDVEWAPPTKVTLVGNSMGAWIAMLYTLDNPQRVERLVLESGAGLSLPPPVPLSATNREEAAVIMRAVHGPNVVMPEWAIDALIARSVDSQMLRVIAGGAATHVVDARLGELDVPTTILWGEHDGVVPRPYIDVLATGIRGAKVQVIEGAAHIPHSQKPELFLECLLATF
jgi:pimeloyl-ACP methyl ester carboxylesterase